MQKNGSDGIGHMESEGASDVVSSVKVSLDAATDDCLKRDAVGCRCRDRDRVLCTCECQQVAAVSLEPPDKAAGPLKKAQLCLIHSVHGPSAQVGPDLRAGKVLARTVEDHLHELEDLPILHYRVPCYPFAAHLEITGHALPRHRLHASLRAHKLLQDGKAGIRGDTKLLKRFWSRREHSELGLVITEHHPDIAGDRGSVLVAAHRVKCSNGGCMRI
mmetsp:Transcript_14269/g.42084  ORF Transcript_14269/g.42084 Transcript_14269/m.42084 type:complete len:217 (-) Transcript_14269:767-1417(-)